ncbi:hypothetical protein DN614_30535 [Klebsiella michiganensis]|uniref:Uncharacterized protein n=1 Tax=Klebsiella michiganensis TaxID=1134687 RepID=A0A2J4Y7P9_9ENTR|nr:hypothetical protein AM394_30935 [Klebsiella oxytoca]ATR13236.1 hypothetical protein CTI57_29415 [Klebsiella pneumoniae]MBX4647812.1 hypothetical protein [Klebsiella michiganensis]MBZ7410752.1 hypothetical protein [Klebsiella grimontii]RWS95785.1 hypothetical protein DN592_27675 [Raoultella ornithinolytica]RWT54738.1 hypothetical protein DN601_25165 [Klebsiella quasipneumoniae subsp. similipneumoniae]TJZ60323.1 hypothetical protein FA013_28580 [Raoultella planticola]TNJ76806.1 hypothetica
MWLDDRTRSGREPKVSPGLASQKETEEERKQQEERLTLSENRIRETKDLRSIIQRQDKKERVSAPLFIRGCAFFFQTLQAPHQCAPEPGLTRFRSEIFPGNSLVAPQAPSQSVPQQTEALFG